jgi:hypothetical protein
MLVRSEVHNFGDIDATNASSGPRTETIPVATQASESMAASAFVGSSKTPAIPQALD